MSPALRTLMIACCVALLYACNSVKLHKTARYTKTDSVAVKHYDSSAVNRKMINSATTIDSAVSNTGTFTEHGITVSFDTSAAPVNDEPVTIEQDGNKTTVIAPGRRIKSITAHNTIATQMSRTDSLHKTAVVNIATIDSSHVKNDDSTGVQKVNKETVKERESQRPPVVGIALFGVLIFGVLWAWKKFHEPLNEV